MKRIVLFILALCLLPFYFEGVAFSTTFTFDLRSSPRNTPTPPNPLLPHENSAVLSEAGLDVTVTGWNLEDLNNGVFRRSQITFWGSGLGVCNPQEGLVPSTCSSSPSLIEHPLDNMDAGSVPGREGPDGFDFALFEFSAPIYLVEAKIRIFGDDSDVTWYAGSGSTPTLLGNTLIGANLGNPNFSRVGHGLSSRTVDLSGTPYNNNISWLLFGADTDIDRPSWKSDLDDGFKIKSLTVSIPSTMLLFGLGFAGFVIWRRKQEGQYQ